MYLKKRNFSQWRVILHMHNVIMPSLKKLKRWRKGCIIIYFIVDKNGKYHNSYMPSINVNPCTVYISSQ